MDTQHISAIHQSKLANFSLALLLGGTLISSAAQASVETSKQLLPPTTTQILEQAVQPTAALTEQKEGKALSQSEIIDQATCQSADAHVITKNKDDSA